MTTISRLLLAFTALLAMTGVAGAEQVGTGDFVFYLDSASFRGADGKTIEEVNIRVPNNEIRFREHRSQFRSRVKLSVLVRDLDGKAIVEDAEKLEFFETTQERADNSRYFQAIAKRYQLPPGRYQISVAIEDLEAPKLTMVGVVSRKNKLSAVRKAQLDVAEFNDIDPGFSDTKFVWRRVEEESGTRYAANPPRMYGLYKDSLAVFLELYLPTDQASQSTFEFQAVVTDFAGVELAVSTIELPPRSERMGELATYPVFWQTDLNRFPAGAYQVVYFFKQDGVVLRRARGGTFSVAWDLRTWEVSRRDFLAEARFLLGDIKFEEFRLTMPGEQEQTLDKLWKSFDPTPETAENEAYREFLTRLAYINDRYVEGNTPAIFTPRGELYMRFGAPDELVEDVIPVNREVMSEAMDKVGDRFHAINYSSTGNKLYNSGTTRDALLDSRGVARPGEGGNVGYPYELWVYHGAGKPILNRDEVMNRDIGARYFFVDREGYGRYQLETTSTLEK